VAVRVRTSNGAPAGFVAITWTAAGSTRGITADASGRVLLTDLPPGEVEIRGGTLTEASREAVRVVVAAGERTDADLVLVPGGRIRLKLQDAAGRPIADPSSVHCGVRDAQGPWPNLGGELESEGALALGTFAPGTYTVFAVLGGREVTQSVTVEAGITRDVVLRAGS
jgi:hypothetical protein